MLLALWLSSSAFAAGTSVTATINVAPPSTRSLTVSTQAVDYDSCHEESGIYAGTALALPHGECEANNVPDGNFYFTVTNGAAASDIDVTGTSAVPSDGGADWTLCGANATGAPACAGTGIVNLPVGSAEPPGADQYIEATNHPEWVHDLALSDSPECDIAFALGSCEAEPGKSEAESLRIEGPESSNDTSSTFTTTITWTAAAP